MAKIAENLGLPLMPWQRLVADTGMELLENGLPAYRQIVVTVPRQSGKTQLLLSIELHRAIMWEYLPQRIYYSAQTGQDARKKLLDDQVPILKDSRLMTAVKRVYEAAGHEGIRFTNGSRIDTTASGEAAGHGVTADLGIIDEAFADLDERREQAMVPSQITRDDAQIWIASTAGHEGSVYLNRKMDAGRAAVDDAIDQGVAYFEWSAEDDDDIADPATWWKCMPALGYTVSEDVIRHSYLSMCTGPNADEGQFRRAFLNQRTKQENRVIPAAVWNEISRPTVEPSEKGLTFAVAASHDREHASIVAIDNQHQAELVRYRPMGKDDRGVTLAEDVAALANKWIAPVALDLKGPEGSIAPDLEAAGVHVVPYSTDEMAKACARFYDALGERAFKVRSHAALDEAAGGARKRMVGDQWVWARRDAYVDISPLVALTVAYDCSTNVARQGGTLWVAFD